MTEQLKHRTHETYIWNNAGKISITMEKRKKRLTVTTETRSSAIVMVKVVTNTDRIINFAVIILIEEYSRLSNAVVFISSHPNQSLHSVKIYF